MIRTGKLYQFCKQRTNGKLNVLSLASSWKFMFINGNWNPEAAETLVVCHLVLEQLFVITILLGNPKHQKALNCHEYKFWDKANDVWNTCQARWPLGTTQQLGLENFIRFYWSSLHSLYQFSVFRNPSDTNQIVTNGNPLVAVKETWNHINFKPASASFLLMFVVNWTGINRITELLTFIFTAVNILTLQNAHKIFTKMYKVCQTFSWNNSQILRNMSP